MGPTPGSGSEGPARRTDGAAPRCPPWGQGLPGREPRLRLCRHLSGPPPARSTGPDVSQGARHLSAGLVARGDLHLGGSHGGVPGLPGSLPAGRRTPDVLCRGPGGPTVGEPPMLSAPAPHIPARALLQTPLSFLFSESVAGWGGRGGGRKDTPPVTTRFGHCRGGRVSPADSGTEGQSATAEGLRRKGRIV